MRTFIKVFFLIYLFIFYLAALAVSCGTQDLHFVLGDFSLGPMDSPVVAQAPEQVGSVAVAPE